MIIKRVNSIYIKIIYKMEKLSNFQKNARNPSVHAILRF